MLHDVNDGLLFKSNPMFKNESFQIILYQDAFEIVNPLGSARKKHKVLGVYFTLANKEPHLRSSIDHMQLVMLCTESNLKFGQDKVFSNLVADLQLLENNGVRVKSFDGEKMMGGTVCAIVGDNLGSHGIGGFCESFRHQNFCRFCLMRLDSFPDKPYELVNVRTVENYKRDAQQADGNDDINIQNGVKFDSVFNSLLYFHVANPGLPPCLRHDLFEGEHSEILSK